MMKRGEISIGWKRRGEEPMKGRDEKEGVITRRIEEKEKKGRENVW